MAGPMLEALREDLLEQYGMFRVEKVDASLDALVEEIRAEERARIAFGLLWFESVNTGYPEESDYHFEDVAAMLEGTYDG